MDRREDHSDHTILTHLYKDFPTSNPKSFRQI